MDGLPFGSIQLYDKIPSNLHTHAAWVPDPIFQKMRERSEVLDCRVYNAAASEILNPNWNYRFGESKYPRVVT